MIKAKSESRGRKKLGPGRKNDRKRAKKDDVLTARMRKKTCRMCEEKLEALDYKDSKRLERLVSERGKILSRRITGACAKHQRRVQEAVKIARFMALLPYLKK